jgi:hypothetical protein
MLARTQRGRRRNTRQCRRPQVAAAWDAAKDESSEDACKAYGVGGVLRMPGRLHITWEADDTLKVESEAGSQTRLLSFGAPRAQGAQEMTGRACRLLRGIARRRR